MKRDSVKELNEKTIDQLSYRKQQCENKIEELKEAIETLELNISDISKILEKKKQIPTINIIKVNKYKPIYFNNPTEIEIYVYSVDKNDESIIMNQLSFRRLKYSDRTQLYDVLVTFKNEFDITKIFFKGIKPTKKICNKFEVIEDITQ